METNEIIKANWVTKDGATNDDIIAHSVLDIARSMRDLTKANVKLLKTRSVFENDLVIYKRLYNENQIEINNLKNRIRGLKSVISRVQNKLNEYQNSI